MPSTESAAQSSLAQSSLAQSSLAQSSLAQSSLAQSLAEPIGGSGLDAGRASVAALGAALAGRTVTASALTAYYLARIERLNPALRAVIEVSPGAAAEAAASDARRAGGAARGPLDGIPVLVKDNVSVTGQPGTAGSPALAGAESGDAWCVRGLRAAGAVVLGKANLSEWANFRSRHSSSGWSTLGGQAVNPHGAGRNPSGSSSGSAVAVAAGLAPLAIGTETDGSIVSPAAACGAVGLKPTVGLVSRSGIVPISAEQDTAGPIARTVADAAALLTALAGPDPADPATAAGAAEVTDYGGFLDPGALDGARLGIWRHRMEAVSPGAAALLDAAIARLRARGATIVDPVDLPDVDEIGTPEYLALVSEFKHDLNAYLAVLPGDHPASLTELMAFNTARAATVMPHFGQDIFASAEATAGDLGDADYLSARTDARRLARAALDAALTAHELDAVISLTGNPAWLTDHVLGDNHVFGSSTPAAVAGYPSITVPAGQVSGLPVGISMTGPAWSEPRLIALAHAFELADPSVDHLANRRG
jgi:amidase